MVTRVFHLSTPEKASSFMELEKARIRWFLSLDYSNLPSEAVSSCKSTFRALTIDGQAIEFSDGFADLHTIVYRETLANRGFSLDDSLPSIQLSHDIRQASPIPPKGEEGHPMLFGAVR